MCESSEKTKQCLNQKPLDLTLNTLTTHPLLQLLLTVLNFCFINDKIINVYHKNSRTFYECSIRKKNCILLE